MDPAGEIANAEGIMINVYVILESSKEKNVNKNSMAIKIQAYFKLLKCSTPF